MTPPGGRAHVPSTKDLIRDREKRREDVARAKKRAAEYARSEPDAALVLETLNIPDALPPLVPTVPKDVPEPPQLQQCLFTDRVGPKCALNLNGCEN